MLVELRARELGVIDELHLLLGPGLSVVTGETGAGKTLVVEALALLLGGRADPAAVRGGAAEALVEGRFVVGGPTGSEEREVILSRVVPREGRARGFIDGRMAPASALAEEGAALVELHGQHASHWLLRSAAQRSALDRFAGADSGPVASLRAECRALDARLKQIGGSSAARARELELVQFQLDEIARAGIVSPQEDAALAEEEAALANATALREAAQTGGGHLGGGEGGEGALDRLGAAIEVLARHGPFEALTSRLRGLAAELGDAASDLRRMSETFEEDPERLEAVRERRNLLHGLCRKYGPALSDVLEFAQSTTARARALAGLDADREALEVARADILGRLHAAEEALGATRRAAAPALGAAIESRLGELALDRARVVVGVPATGTGDEIEILLAANPGEEAVPLAKAASGGELSRVMLALRLVLSEGPPTMIFDEVDAGIGGTAGLAVGRSLAELARAHQVIVVTHLAQVAAFAHRHLQVTKHEVGARTVTRVKEVEGDERVAELSRMLSGHPDSAAARRHASELLASAANLVGPRAVT